MAHPPGSEQAPASPVREGRLRSLRRTALLNASSMTLLLALLIATVFILPVISPRGRTSELINDVSLTLILLAGAAAIARVSAVAIAAGAVCIIAIALRWSEWLLPGGISHLAREGSALLALLVVTVIVAIRVFGAGSVTLDRIMGAVALYLLLGIAWAVGYDLVAVNVPNAFSREVTEQEGPARWIYFSFVTLTTVGFGDITPVARAARSLAMLEALVGQLYPAIILARLVSLRGEGDDRPAR